MMEESRSGGKQGERGGRGCLTINGDNRDSSDSLRLTNRVSAAHGVMKTHKQGQCSTWCQEDSQTGSVQHMVSGRLTNRVSAAHGVRKTQKQGQSSTCFLENS